MAQWYTKTGGFFGTHVRLYVSKQVAIFCNHVTLSCQGGGILIKFSCFASKILILS